MWGFAMLALFDWLGVELWLGMGVAMLECFDLENKRLHIFLLMCVLCYLNDE